MKKTTSAKRSDVRKKADRIKKRAANKDLRAKKRAECKLQKQQKRVKIKPTDILYDAGILVFGAALYGIGMDMCLKPAGIIMGGATGIATTLNSLLGTPIGLFITLINVPLIIWSITVSGLRNMLKTIVAVAGASVAVDLLTFLPAATDDPLLCAISGGFIMGAGAGVFITRGFTTGGSDLAAFLIKRKFKRLSTGRFIFLIDCVIIVSSALIMKTYQGILYSLVSIVIYSAAVDLIMGGSNRAKLMLIFSDKYDEIAPVIMKNLTRGVTSLNGRGEFTGMEKHVLMCAVKRHEEYTLRTIVYSIDPKAFMVIAEASEVLGYGFKTDGE